MKRSEMRDFKSEIELGKGGEIRTHEHMLPRHAHIAVCGTPLRKLVWMAGFEPANTCFRNKPVSPSAEHPEKIGWRGRIRTCINFASSDSKSEMFPFTLLAKRIKLLIVMPKYTQTELEIAVNNATSYCEVLRNLKMCETGGNYATLKKYISLWKIKIDHFTTASQRARLYLNKPPRPLEEILVKNSSYNRTNLKKRLYSTGIKKPICELCGQDENWNGKKIALILDHKNGIRNDNRLNNLRIVCPNCNAALETHCGKQSKNKCAGCSNLKPLKKKYCSIKCYRKYGTQRLLVKTRKVSRPAFRDLVTELKETSYLAVGKKYGVSDNAVRKWIKTYEKYGE